MLTTRPTVEAPRGFYRRPMMIIGMLYFMTGALSRLDGPLMAFVKPAHRFDDVRAPLIAAVFHVPYFILALPHAVLLKRIEKKRGRAAGLGVMSIGALMFSQFSGMHSYPGTHGTLASLLAIGAGLSLTQPPTTRTSASWDPWTVPPVAWPSWICSKLILFHFPDTAGTRADHQVS